jgi:RNA polymerase sigma-70 factor (ECF subfamily)
MAGCEPSHVFLHCNIRGLPGFILEVSHALRVFSIFPQLVWRLDPPEADSTRVPQVEGNDDDDGAVFTRASTGDERAWQELFTRWKKPLLAFFYRSLSSMPEAEDLTLEVFVRLHRAAPRYEARGHFASYLFHIARNLLLNELRRRRRKPALPLPPDALDYLPSASAHDSRQLAELEEEFQCALGELPESQRTLLLLIQQQGLDHSEAATVLGITENALRVQLHRARQRLKELMSSRS